MEEPLKIPYERHSICEKIVYYIIEKIDEHNLFKNIHPNIITITRILFVLISFYLYNKKSYGVLLIIAFFMNMFLDYLDGYVARKYNKITVAGDILDHVSDWITFLLFYISIKRKTLNNNILLFIHLLFVLSYLGTYQKIYNDINNKNSINESIDIITKLSIFNEDFHLFFSDITLYIHLILLFIYKNLI
jgi:phosphatidylserine synthase